MSGVIGAVGHEACVHAESLDDVLDSLPASATADLICTKMQPQAATVAACLMTR